MKFYIPAILCGAVLLLCLAAPATCAVTPLWIEPATLGGELSGVVISGDESTIVTGGDQLIVLSRNGEKRWTGWSAEHLAVSRDGNYILASQGRVVRLISGAKTIFWERSMDSIVTDISLSPDASAIAVTGGGQIRTMSGAGEAIATNTSMAINHARIMPSGKQVLMTTYKSVQMSNLTLVPHWSDTGLTQDLVEVAPDGSSFVTATNNRIRMYNGTGGHVWEQRLPGGNALALAYSHDGSTIVVGTDDSNVRVLDNRGTLLWTANATNWITSVAVSENGNVIVAGSMDKKVHAFNHAGERMGIFSARSAIEPHSIAITGDGSLIVVVDQTAVYGILRSAFIPEEIPEVATTGTTPEITGETVTTVPAATTARITATRTLFIPTPYPTDMPTEEAGLPLLVPLMAVGILLLWWPKNR